MTSSSQLAQAVRSLLKSPALTTIAVTTLAIGLGANALLFSVIESVLLRPLPFSAPERIYTARTMFAGEDPAKPGDHSPVSGPVFSAWRRGCGGCESMALVFANAVNLGGITAPERVDALSASPQLFPMLGIQVQLGRGFSEADDKQAASEIVVISDSLWRRNFGGDRAVIGRRVIWNRTPVEIIGVLRPDFRFPRGEQTGAMINIPEHVDIIRPFASDPDRLGPAFNYAALVKLRPGVSVEQASGEMNRQVERSPDRLSQRARARLTPLKERMVFNARGPLWLLWGAALLLLVIVCVNTGNLLLLRAARRQREWSIRAAIGASRMDLCRQALTESFVLAGAASVLGLGGAIIGIRLLPGISLPTMPRLDEVTLDRSALLVILLISLGAALVCGLAPMWRIFRTTPQLALANTSRLTDTRAERRGGKAIVVCETGLSVVLTACGVLLLASFANVLGVDKGFDPDRVITFQLSLEGQYTGERRGQYHTELLDKLESLPGVLSAGLISRLPLQGETFVSELRRAVAGTASDWPQANYRYVSPKYFEAVGTSLRVGRLFDESDRQRNVVILSARAAERLFGSESGLGQKIEFDDDGGPGQLEVVGVVADAKAAGLEADAPYAVYLPFWRIPLGGASYVVRTSSNLAALIPSMREAAFSVARDVPIYHVREMSTIVDAALATRRLQAGLAAGFALVGVLLTCLGVFGVVSDNVSKRTGEIGVRMALGATGPGVMGMVVRETLEPVLLGLFCGMGVSIMLGRVLTSQLYGISSRDPEVLCAVAAIVLIASVSAAFIPAVRASRVEPIRALYWE